MYAGCRNAQLGAVTSRLRLPPLAARARTLRTGRGRSGAASAAGGCAPRRGWRMCGGSRGSATRAAAAPAGHNGGVEGAVRRAAGSLAADRRAVQGSVQGGRGASAGSVSSARVGCKLPNELLNSSPAPRQQRHTAAMQAARHRNE
jgi:hypothetical protein